MSDEQKIYFIKLLIAEILDGKSGKFDWYKSDVGKKILEIHEILK